MRLFCGGNSEIHFVGFRYIERKHWATVRILSFHFNKTPVSIGIPSDGMKSVGIKILTRGFSFLPQNNRFRDSPSSPSGIGISAKSIAVGKTSSKLAKALEYPGLHLVRILSEEPSNRLSIPALFHRGRARLTAAKYRAIHCRRKARKSYFYLRRIF